MLLKVVHDDATISQRPISRVQEQTIPVTLDQIQQYVCLESLNSSCRSWQGRETYQECARQSVSLFPSMCCLPADNAHPTQGLSQTSAQAASLEQSGKSRKASLCPLALFGLGASKMTSKQVHCDQLRMNLE